MYVCEILTLQILAHMWDYLNIKQSQHISPLKPFGAQGRFKATYP